MKCDVIYNKGRREKTNDRIDVNLPQPRKKSSYLPQFLFFSLIFLSRFWAHQKKWIFIAFFKNTKTKIKQKHLGSLQKMWLFFLRFFSPSVVLLDFFYRVHGRFVTRGAQERNKKKADFFSRPPKAETRIWCASWRPSAPVW
jgi:hypothetical protein